MIRVPHVSEANLILISSLPFYVITAGWSRSISFCWVHSNIYSEIMEYSLFINFSWDKSYERCFNMLVYQRRSLAYFVWFFCFISFATPRSIEWHIVILFFVTSYFCVSPSARTVNSLTRCTYSQLLLQESSPNEESLHEIRWPSQTTGVCKATGYISSHTVVPHCMYPAI